MTTVWRENGAVNVAQPPAAKVQMVARKGAIRREIANSGGKTERTARENQLGLQEWSKRGVVLPCYNLQTIQRA